MSTNNTVGVTAIISTKDRYETSLPQCLISIANQTYRPKHIIIYDDGEQKDLREMPMYQNIFLMLSQNGISWEVKFGERMGQVRNHQRSLKDTETEWIWRIDDDNVMSPNVLERLVSNIASDVGAIGGLVIDPKMNMSIHRLASNKIEDIYLGLNIQWFKNQTEIREVDHLYSTFIYRKEASSHGYNTELSRVGHREETMFTYEMTRAGWKLLVDPSALTWHFRNSDGGIRAGTDGSFWMHDEQIFAQKLKDWGVTPKQIKLCVLDSGLGDHLVFKAVLPEIKKKHSNVVLAVCYPDVFKDDTDVELISIAEANMMGDMREHNIYKKMWDWGWKDSIESAYRRLYV